MPSYAARRRAHRRARRRANQDARSEPVADLIHTREFNPVAFGYYASTLEHRAINRQHTQRL